MVPTGPEIPRSRTTPGKRERPVSPGFLQLGAGDTDYKVVSALLPEKLESWMGEEREEVTFYPFVVVLETSEGKQFCWTPNLRTCWGTQSHATQ